MTVSILTPLLPETCKILQVSAMLPDEIIQKIQQQGVNKHDIVCLYNYEVWRYGNDPLLQKFLSECEATFLIFHMGYSYKKTLANVHEIPWPHYFFARNTQIKKFVPKQSGLPWGFSCLNNKQNIHRLLFGYELWRNDLISSVIFTQNTVHADDIQGFHRVILDTMPDYENYQSLLPIRWPNESTDSTDFSYCHTVQHDAFSKCYAHIVTETELESFYYPGVAINTPTITEKSFKPFQSGQIPLYLAPSGHLAYLQYLGFEIMDTLLPENYDQSSTLGKITALIRLIKQGKDFIESAYYDNLSLIQHNFDLIQSQTTDDMVIADTKELIQKCLDS